jgi:hypothetical protein
MDVEVTERTLRSLRRQRLTYEQIAERTGLTRDDVEARIASAWRRAAEGGTSFVAWNELTIQLRASAVRQHWTPEEEEKRRAAPSWWTPPDSRLALADVLGYR